LLVHLSRHEGTAAEATENSLAHLTGELSWKADFAESSVRRAERQGYITRQNGDLKLTENGREVSRQVLSR
jgi:Mn-dependent DtxR family transcriptional regulator